MNDHDPVSPDHRTTQRRVPGLRAVLIALPLLLLAVVVPLLANSYYWSERLAQQHAELRAAGEPVTWQDIMDARPPIPDDQNGATFYQQAYDLITPSMGGVPAELASPADELGVRRDVALRELAQRHLDASAEVLDLLRQGAQRERSQYPLLPDPVTAAEVHFRDVRRAARLCAAAAFYDAEEGRAGEAATNIRTILDLGRSLSSEPVISSALLHIATTRIAWNTVQLCLGVGSLQAEDLETLRSELEQARDALPGHLADGFRAERIAGVDGIASDVESRIWSVLQHVPGWMKQQAFHHAEMMSDLVAICTLPPRERYRALKEFTARWQKVQMERTLTKVCALIAAPASATAVREELCAEMEVAVTIAALAAEQYRMEHGEWPESLRALVPTILPQIPQDFFSPGPLRYRRTHTGVRIYSVGEDGHDNGGVAAEEVADPMIPRDWDIVFRLLDPQLRGAETLGFREGIMRSGLDLPELEAAGLTRERLLELGLTEYDLNQL